MDSFRKREIVLFPFPYTDLSNRKLRPCLVISEEILDDIILCQITSQYSRKDKYCVELINEKLRIKSYIRTNMIFTADKSQIVRRIGKISKEKYVEVAEKVVEIIAL